MRVSAIADWTTCEAMALARPAPGGSRARRGLGRNPGPRHPSEQQTQGRGHQAPALRCHYQDGARGGRSIGRYRPRGQPLFGARGLVDHGGGARGGG